MLYLTEYVIKTIFFITLLLVNLSACYAPTATSTPAVSVLNEGVQVASIGKNYWIRFSPSVDNMPLNHYFEMDVWVTGFTHQTLLYPLTLEIDAGMKAHNHGMNVQPKITRLGNGRFSVKGMLFHMSGQWFIHFTLRRGTLSDHVEVNVLVQP